MNEKFYEQKKEKQDLMINGAMRVFARNGYRNASTDDMGKVSGVSKGLWFHYFENKKGLYQFVAVYGIKYALLELELGIDETETDYFKIMQAMEEVKMKLMEKDKCEADRCISCNRVCECCVSVCPNRANIAIAVPGYDMRQILHVDYMCNECGNCAHFCPYTNGRPYKDKFTLFANEKDFEDSENSGFMVVCPACPKVKVRLNGEVKEYTLDGTSDLDRKLEDLMLTVIRDYSYLIG